MILRVTGFDSASGPIPGNLNTGGSPAHARSQKRERASFLDDMDRLNVKLTRGKLLAAAEAARSSRTSGSGQILANEALAYYALRVLNAFAISRDPPAGLLRPRRGADGCGIHLHHRKAAPDVAKGQRPAETHQRTDS